MRKIDKPHDKLFKWAFSQEENARDLLYSLLPATLLETLDLGSMIPASENNVDDTLTERFLDRMFSVPFRGTDQEMYTIFEHKSWPERWVLFDAAGYSVDVARWFRRNNPAAPGPHAVVAVIVYHAKAEQTLPSSLHSIYHCPTAARKALGMRAIGLAPVIYDLTQETEVQLRQRGMNPMATLVLWMLARAQGNEDIARDLRMMRDVILDCIERPRGGQELDTIFRYVATVCDVPSQELENFLANEIGPVAHEVYMTLAQALREEGREKGLIEGQRNVLLMQLKERFSVVPDDLVQQISAASAEQLDAWLKRFVSATTIDGVFNGRR